MSTRAVWSGVFALVAAATLDAGLRAQQDGATLHRAWLREVLDGDTAGAVRVYGRLAADPSVQLLDRRIAAARLIELRRIGLAGDVAPPPMDLVPQNLQQTIQWVPESQAIHPTIVRELDLAGGEPAAMRQFLATTSVPQLRPFAFALARATMEETEPEIAEISRQRTRFFMPTSDNPAWLLDRARASDIVRAELEARRADADRLRQRYFPHWRPQPWPEDASASWTLARQSLGQWQRETQLTTAEKELLAGLATHLETLAADDPKRALEFIARLPLYAERLRTQR